MFSNAILRAQTDLPLSRGNRTRKSSTYDDRGAVAVGCSELDGGLSLLIRTATPPAAPA